MAADTSSESDQSEKEGDILNLEDDEGWDDVEPDIEKVTVVSLFDDKVFDDVAAMVAYCKEAHHFDFVAVQRTLNLDFLESIKLVNYIRSNTQQCRRTLDIPTKAVFQDDAYLAPVLEDDPLLYSLEDVIVEDGVSNANRSEVIHALESPDELNGLYSGIPQKGVDPLERQLATTKEELLRSNQQLELTQKALEQANISAERLREKLGKAANGQQAPTENSNDPYSGTSIHRQMLEDKVRTDAYRDFILGNKHLFDGKTVLDVGCGTGILSMFCAQAGAKRVFTIEQSSIYLKAQKIVYDNGFQERIKVLHGKVEEVHLPVSKVDIIVSEWMGYALLYEGMLDSVIWARNRYLIPGGLMVPSSTILKIAPFANQEYAHDRLRFWESVYGFDMSAMGETHQYPIYTDGIVKSDWLCRTPSTFRELDMYKVGVPDLSFDAAEFKCRLLTGTSSSNVVDGFAIWFTVHFSNEPNAVPGQGRIDIDTGPNAMPTHWGQAVLLFGTENSTSEAFESDDSFTGKVSYCKGKEPGSLEIGVTWGPPGLNSPTGGKWLLRNAERRPLVYPLNASMLNSVEASVAALPATALGGPIALVIVSAPAPALALDPAAPGPAQPAPIDPAALAAASAAVDP